MKSILRNLPILAFLAVLMACGGNSRQESAESSTSAAPGLGQSAVQDDVSNPNIVQVAVGSPDHTTLVAALKAAEYVDALTNVGPFTVFAPTDAAFGELPAGTVESLVEKENQRKLRDILEYHVLLGVYKAESFVNGQKIGTAEGGSVTMEVQSDGTILVNGAKIIGSIQTSNGMIHVVDKVLLPE
jgi:uncharacterized surface protein with fasciclin (FAS1) repeats